MARHFSNWLKAYAEHTSVGESPYSFNFWTGVSTVAGALRRKVWIDQLRFKWYVNFYIVLVAPAGIATKSTSIEPGMRMLSKVKGVEFGPQSMTWQSLIKSLQNANQEISVVLPDGTIQTQITSPITIPVSELGTFFKMEDDAMMDVLTSLWDSKEGEWTHTTVTSGKTTIQNPWINIIGCTTPTWIKQHFPEHMIGGGLASRMIFIYADRKNRLVAYPAEHVKPVDFHYKEKLLVEDLQHISKLKGQYILDKEALEWGTAWYRHHWEGPRAAHMASERFAGYISRKQTHMHKLAMVLAAAERDTLVLTRADLELSLKLIELVEPHMQSVFESIGEVDEARRTKEIVQFVRAHRTLTSKELWSLVSNIMTHKEFQDALRSAVDSGIFRVCMKDGERAVTLSAQALKASAPRPPEDTTSASPS